VHILLHFIGLIRITEYQILQILLVVISLLNHSFPQISCNLFLNLFFFLLTIEYKLIQFFVDLILVFDVCIPHIPKNLVLVLDEQKVLFLQLFSNGPFYLIDLHFFVFFYFTLKLGFTFNEGFLLTGL
jgi:hypothetical protein